MFIEEGAKLTFTPNHLTSEPSLNRHSWLSTSPASTIRVDCQELGRKECIAPPQGHDHSTSAPNATHFGSGCFRIPFHFDVQSEFNNLALHCDPAVGTAAVDLSMV